MKVCPTCKMTVKKDSECPFCYTTLTYEPTVSSDREKYKWNKYFVLYLLKRCWFSFLCLVFIVVRMIIEGFALDWLFFTTACLMAASLAYAFVPRLSRKGRLLSLLCILLVLSVSANVYCVIKLHSDKEKQIHSVITAIYRQTSALQEVIQETTEKENYSWSSIGAVQQGFDSLADLYMLNRDIAYPIRSDAKSDLRYIRDTVWDPDGIYGDETITENEIEYLKKLIEILDKTLLNVGADNKNTYDAEILSQNLTTVHELLHSRENSPYLLIRDDISASAERNG